MKRRQERREERNAFQQKQSGDLFVELWNTDLLLAAVHVAADDADAFFMSEYLAIRQRVRAACTADDFAVFHKAFIAFVRHGHGEKTVSQFGTTLDD